MTNFIIENQNYINILFTFLLAIIPTFFNLKKKNGKKLSFFGWSFIYILISLLILSVFSEIYNSKMIINNDLKIKISFRSLKGRFEISDLPKDLPEKIPIPDIKINNYRTAGTLIFEKQSVGKGKSMNSVFFNYTCTIPIYLSDESSPKSYDEIIPKEVSIHLNLDEVLSNKYILNGNVRLRVGKKEYYGIRNSENRIEFVNHIK